MKTVIQDCLLWSVLTLIVVCVSQADSASVVLFPYGHGFNSRLLDMRKMALLLQENGHQITFLVNSEDRQHLQSVRNANYFEFPTPEDRVPFINDKKFKTRLMNSANSTQVGQNTLLAFIKRHLVLCEALLQERDVLENVKRSHFDLLIVDFADNCGRIITQYLDIPTMVYSSTGLHVDQSLFPNLPSLVPMPMTGLPGTMNFWQRTKNTLVMLAYEFFLGPYFYGAFQDLQRKYQLEDPKVHFRKAYANKLIIANSDFAYDYPRPLLPNVILVGGMHVDPPKPLPPDLEEFMEESGEAGVILVSFGSLVGEMDEAKSEMIANVLSRFPQRVIWRYTGEPPKGVGVNTKLLSWLPQNDLLAHPKTRLFITHCGIHGTHEAIHHAVPVVAVPLMFDQHENAAKLLHRARSGVYVNFNEMTEETLEEGIRETLINPVYRDNARTTSMLVKDHPVSARELFLFYANFLIRHKGTGRLYSEQVQTLNSLQLYSVDVFLILLLIVFVVVCCICCLIRSACRRICRPKINGNSQTPKIPLKTD